MSRRFIALVLALSLSPLNVQAAHAGQPLRIATWNIEHLSEDGAKG